MHRAEGGAAPNTSNEDGRALRGVRQGVGQSSVNKTEGSADCVTQEQSSVKGRAELKAKADKLCFFTFIHFVILFYTKFAFFFWDAVIENRSGLRPSGGGLRPKMGRSQYVKISPAM